MVWKVKRWGFFKEDIPALLGSLGRFPVPLLGRWKMGPRPLAECPRNEPGSSAQILPAVGDATNLGKPLFAMPSRDGANPPLKHSLGRGAMPPGKVDDPPEKLNPPVPPG